MGSLYHMYHFCFKPQKPLFRDILLLGKNFSYFSLGSIPISPTREQINEEMPEIFKRTYPSTQYILDCTELIVNDRPQARYTHTTKVMSHIKVSWVCLPLAQ